MKKYTYALLLITAFCLGIVLDKIDYRWLDTVFDRDFIVPFFFMVVLGFSLKKESFSRRTIFKSYLLSVIGVVLGGAIAYPVSIHLGIDPLLIVAYIGTYIGGSANYLYISDTYLSNFDDALISAGLVADVLVTSIYSLIIVCFSLLKRRDASKYNISTDNTDTVYAGVYSYGITIFILFLISFVYWYAGTIFDKNYLVLMIVFALCAPLFMSIRNKTNLKLASNNVASFLLLLIVTKVGYVFELSLINQGGESLLALASTIVFVHVIFLVVYRFIFKPTNKQEYFENGVMCSCACIAGVGSAVAVSIIINRKDLIPFAVVFGALGYIFSFVLIVLITEIAMRM